MSHTFHLGRGMRQWCPLSPLLFALAIKPLAILIRDNPGITGFCYSYRKEKAMPYADDTMIMLGDTNDSCGRLQSLLLNLGIFKINWSKSGLMVIDSEGTSQGASEGPFPITISFKYLGVQISLCICDFCRLNISPHLQKFCDHIGAWNSTHLSVAGKVHLIKMILMPQLLYFLHKAPVMIPFNIFRMVIIIFRTLIWKDHTPRIKLEHLQQPKDDEELHCPILGYTIQRLRCST